MSEEIDYWEKLFDELLAIDLGVPHKSPSFKNLRELRDWVDNELNFVTKIYEGARSDLNSCNHATNSHLNKAKNHINAAHTDLQNNVDESHNLEQAISYIQNLYQGNKMVLSDSPEGAFLSDLAAKSSALVDSALCELLDFDQQDFHKISGIVEAKLFKAGTESFSKAHAESFKKLVGEINKNKTSYLKDIHDTSIQATELKDKLKIDKDAYAEQFAMEFKGHQEQMARDEEYLREKLKFQAAIRYWHDKAKRHRGVSIGFGLAAFLVMIAIIIVMLLAIPSSDQELNKHLFTEAGSLHLWVYGLFGVIATLTLWILSVLMRVCLSNLHLITDANERATLIETFLSLAREEQMVSEEDKSIILPAIFRHGASGIVKEDGAPATPLSILAGKIIGSK